MTADDDNLSNAGAKRKQIDLEALISKPEDHGSLGSDITTPGIEPF